MIGLEDGDIKVKSIINKIFQFFNIKRQTMINKIYSKKLKKTKNLENLSKN